MMTSSASSSSPPFTNFPFPIKEQILKLWFKDQVKSFSRICINKHGPLKTHIIHPDFPFFTIINLTHPSLIPSKYRYHFMRSLIQICNLSFLIDTNATLAIINLSILNQIQPHQNG